MNDGVEAREVRGGDVAHVTVQRRYPLHRRAEIAAAVEKRVESRDLVTRGRGEWREHRTDIAVVTRDEDSHDKATGTFRAKYASAYPLGERHSIPRMRIRPRKISASNQCLSRWVEKASTSRSTFS